MEGPGIRVELYIKDDVVVLVVVLNKLKPEFRHSRVDSSIAGSLCVCTCLWNE